MAVPTQASYDKLANADTLAKSPRAASEQYLRLLICVVGIYVCFLSWGLLQERISTRAYTAVVDGMVVSSRFPSFFVLNVVQASIATVLAWASLSLSRRHEAHGSSIGLLAIWHNPRLFWSYIRLALSSCLASPFGYAALAHITYPTMILGKSCKLVPVMLVSVLLHGRRYPPIKYATVALITAGVSIFMLFDGSHSRKGSASNSLLGVALLLVNLFLDGLTNSWQDELFRRYRVRSQHLMFYMNLFSCLFMASYLCTRHLLSLLQHAGTSELARFVDFIGLHPACLVDMLLFGLLGAAGQLFIFHTIEHFGAVLLVTVTVTRKLATMLVSVVCFGHAVRWQQAVGIGAVFASLAIDSFAHQHKASS